MKPSNGVLWRGLSPYDRTPIALVVTGVRGNEYSDNQKTTGGSKRLHRGRRPKAVEPFAQAFILVDKGMTALEVIRNGLEGAICGDCPHRGVLQPDGSCKGRTCYVEVYKSVQTTSKKLIGVPVRSGVRALAYGDSVLAEEQGIRYGAYGDPGMVPLKVIAAAEAITGGRRTGYTHQWRRLRANGHGRFMMASCDSVGEAEEAIGRGWRTFLVIPQGAKAPKQIGGQRLLPCPAAKENGSKIACSQCQICSGTDGKGECGVVIQAHGNGAKRFCV